MLIIIYDVMNFQFPSAPTTAAPPPATTPGPVGSSLFGDDDTRLAHFGLANYFYVAHQMSTINMNMQFHKFYAYASLDNNCASYVKCTRTVVRFIYNPEEGHIYTTCCL